MAEKPAPPLPPLPPTPGRGPLGNRIPPDSKCIFGSCRATNLCHNVCLGPKLKDARNVKFRERDKTAHKLAKQTSVEMKAPQGAYRVLGVDHRALHDWHIGDYATQAEAEVEALLNTQGDVKAYIYDDKGVRVQPSTATEPPLEPLKPLKPRE
jgi:hypothetical protein